MKLKILNRNVRQLVIPLLCLTTTYSELAAASVLEEGWYRMRSRDNMKIGNYAAAIEAYEKHLQLQPNDREALLGIAVAYEKQGETDKAIARYDKYLNIYQDDPATAFKQANYLIWSRYAYRKKDAIRYFEMGLKEQDNPAERLKLAQLLAQDKYDLAGAAKQYEILLQQEPGNTKVRNEYRNLLLWDDRFLAKAIEQQEYHVQRNPKDFKARVQLAELMGKSSQRKTDGVALYAKLVKEKPNDNKLRRDYARLLAVTPGNFEEARSQYRILVKQQPDSATKLEAARLLEQKQQYRPEALELYSQILAREPGNKQVRMRHAAIYMDDKSTAQQALNDYDYILKQDVTDAAAHQGAAKALAWLERPDDALYHAKLARQYSKESTASTHLYDELAEGREPRVTALLSVPYQNGDEGYQLRGLNSGVGISGDVSPYLTLRVAGGKEEYKGESEENSGAWWQLQGEYRLDPARKINLAMEDHGIREEGSTQTFALSYTRTDKPPAWSYTLGYAGKLVDDSYLSLVGDPINGLGGATQHELYAYLATGDDTRFWFRPAIGWVESAEEDQNEFVNLSGAMRLAISQESDLKTFWGSEVTYMSYATDHSGFVVSDEEPKSGGYFSPQTFVSLLIFADLATTIGEAGELMARLGPKVQLVDDAGATNDVSVGFFGSLDYTHKQSDALYLTARLAHDEVGSLYKNTLLQAQLIYIF